MAKNTQVKVEAEYNTPDEKVVKKVIDSAEVLPRDYVELPENLANEKLVTKFQSVANDYMQKFIGQASRTELEEYLKDADAKYRVGRTQAAQFREGSSQVDNTLSHVGSTQFYKSVNTIAAGLKDIMFGKMDELPARYDPMVESDDYGDLEGERIADGHNLYLSHVWNKCGYTQVLKDSIDLLIKNANEVFSVEWDYCTKTKVERLPGFYTKDGEAVEYDGQGGPYYNKAGKEIEMFKEDGSTPNSYVFVEKTRIIRNAPVIERHDLRNTFFDLDIDSMQDQTCVIFHSQKPYRYFLDKALSGEYVNVEKISNAQLFKSDESSTDKINNDRDDNADSSRDRDVNGLYDCYHVVMLAPIDDKKKEWDSKQIPQIYEGVFVGKLGNITGKDVKDGETAAVCVQCRKHPYHHGRMPYHLVHSHKDQRGAFHMGVYSLLECNIEEQTATKNNLYDNWKLGIKAPFIAERGNVLSRDLTFHNGNQILWVKPGTGRTALQKLDIPNMTQTALPILEDLRKEADETVGTNDAVKGEFAGSRTTASEVINNKAQAMKPLIEMARYISDQYFMPLLTDVADLARQFGDPEHILTVTDGNGAILGEVNPAELYGELDVKITSIDKFESDIEAQQVLVNFLQAGGYEQSKEFMGKTGAVEFWRNFAEAMKLPNAYKIYPDARKNVEAENQAWADIRLIEADPQRAMSDPDALPKDGEEHEVHIGILSAWLQKVKILSGNPALSPQEKEALRQRIVAAELYIQIHEQMLEAEEAQVQQQAGVTNQAATTPELPGEAQGDVVSGIQGQVTA